MSVWVRTPFGSVPYQSKNVILTKGLGIVLFTGILLVCALAAGAETFGQGFLLTFGLMVWIGIYDTCFLDWVLFPGIVFALIPAALVGWIVTVIR